MREAKRIISAILVAALLVSTLVIGMPMTASAAGSFASVGGWNETIYAKISGISDSDVTGVSYSGPTSGSLTGEDLQYLVRDEGGYTRIDVLGLTAGTYTLTVQTTSGTLTQSGIKVEAQDRSGYAHFNYTEGVGAYNDDGTLKSNAIVLYVTDSNKNSVTVTSKDGTTVTGIGNILGSTGMDVGTGLNSKGGKANTNHDILRKLAADGTPLVVRLIGDVTAPEGLTAYDSIDYGGTEGDNGFMARMSGGKDITIEGVGTGATMNGWGLHFICQTADYALGYGKSFEVRNITFKNVPEDCVGMEGQQSDDDTTLTAPVERCWIHHCSFIGPTISNPAESDKDGGDGACDFKRGNYFTNSYCYYEGYHKTNLVGSSNDSLQYHLTYHHNYWKNCESRGPLARQADIHMYNNIFEGQTSYCMNPRANAYIFSEYNQFLNCKAPVTVDSGAVKSYNDSFTGCTGDNDATIVTDKSTKVSTSCLYANFDTNASVSYVASGDYELQEDVVEARKVVLAYAGAMKETVIAPEDVDTSVIPEDRKPQNPVALPYSQSLNKTYITSTSTTVDNIIFNLSKTASDSVTVGGTSGCNIVFYVNTTVNISMTEVSGTYSPQLCDENGIALLTGSGTVTNLPAGYYFIQSETYDPGSSKYKEAKVSALAIEAVITHGDNDHTYTSVVTPPTCTEGGYTTYTCECGASYTGNETPAAGHKPGAAATCTAAQTCTVCGEVLAEVLAHTYVNGVCKVCDKVDPATCAHTNTDSVVTAPSCTADGYTTYTCDDCGSSWTDNTVAATGHKPGAAATCTTAQTCTVCGETVAAALGHSYADGVCSVCGQEDPLASGYVHSFDDGLPASGSFYSASGSLSDGKGSVTYNGVTINQCLKMSTSASVSFTAPQDGTVTLVFNPSNSGYTIYINGGNSTAIPSDGIVTLDVTANTSYTIKKNKSESFLYYIVYTPSSSGGAHTHSYSSVITAPTCTEAGYTTYTCSCGDSYVADEVAATGHSYSNGICTVCGAVDPNSGSHTHSYTAKVTAPTCTAAGYTTYTCACGDSYQADQVAALGHKYTSKVTAPTCTEAGYTTHICGTCGDTYKDSNVAALGHNYVNGVCSVCGKEETAVEIQAFGHLESAYAEWGFVDGADGYNVYVQASGASGWTQLDNMLIRQYSDYMRADAVGLKAGKYVLKVVPLVSGAEQEDQAMVTDTVTVLAHDRSGYAFVSGASLKGGQTVSTSSGAYNDDGTLKSNAVVVYVTEANKNSVTASIGGTTYTGISNILAGSVLKNASVPICVRLIGNITDLGSGDAFDKGDLLIDNNGNSVGLTIEGIGEDATVNGFGIRLKNSSNVEIRNLAVMNTDSSEGDNIGIQQTCDHIWVHNCDLFYGDAGSDADQAKGDGALDTKKSEYITHSYNHFWDTGKSNLQGGTKSDTSNYITYHHNWYDHSDSRHPRVRVATVHVYNNYYDGVSKYGIGATTDSDIFSEANYFRNTRFPMLISMQGSDIYDPLTGAYDGEGTFSGENGGMIKSYGDVIIGAERFVPNSENSTQFDAVVVENRNDTVSGVSAVLGGAGYNNFDTASNFYDYNVQTAEEAKETVMEYAGRVGGGDFKWTFTEADDTDYDVNTELKAALKSYDDAIVAIGGNSVDTGASGGGTEGGGSTEPTEPDTTDPTEPDSTDPTDPIIPPVSSGSYVHNFTDDGFTSTFYTFAGSKITNGKHGTYTYDFGNGTETLNDALKFDSGGSAKFTPTANGTLTIAVASEKSGRKVVINDGSADIGTVTIDTADKLFVLTVDVSANVTYTVKRSSGESGLYYIAYTPDVVEPTLFDIPGVTMSLGNNLAMYFYVPAANVADGYYAEVTKTYADGRADVVETVLLSQCPKQTVGGAEYYMVAFNGISAKEMTDELYCIVYDADGVQVSNKKTTSVETYGLGMLNAATTGDKLKTLLADMLNYGAEAQKSFGYNTGAPANANMTETHKSYATAEIDMSALNAHVVKGAGWAARSLTLRSSIQLNVFFDTSVVTKDMVAKISYTNHNGTPVSYEIAGSEFVDFDATHVYLNIESLVAADLETVVSIDIYDGETLVSESEYNMAEYCKAQSTDTMLIALAKYCTSAYNYFHTA